jgi:hypothetical protein
MPVKRIALAVGFLLAVVPATAQITTGSIAGTVVDPQGAVVPNAKVTLINTAQGAASAREVTSNAEGTFLFTPVLPGTYTLTVDVMGFKKYTQSGIIMNVNDRMGLPPINLEVGNTGEIVNVQANAIALETVTAERSGVVTGRQMVDLGLNGRNFTGLLRTVPGSSADNSSTTNDINGQRNIQNNYTVDGQTVTDNRYRD